MRLLKAKKRGYPLVCVCIYIYIYILYIYIHTCNSVYIYICTYIRTYIPHLYALLIASLKSPDKSDFSIRVSPQLHSHLYRKSARNLVLVDFLDPESWVGGGTCDIYIYIYIYIHPEVTTHATLFNRIPQGNASHNDGTEMLGNYFG